MGCTYQLRRKPCITTIELIHLATPTHSLQGHHPWLQPQMCTKTSQCNCSVSPYALSDNFVIITWNIQIWRRKIMCQICVGLHNASQCIFYCFAAFDKDDIGGRGGMTFYSPLIEKSSCWYSEWAEDGRTHGKSDSTIMLNPLFRATWWISRIKLGYYITTCTDIMPALSRRTGWQLIHRHADGRQQPVTEAVR